jgi:hypothetical protein
MGLLGRTDSQFWLIGTSSEYLSNLAWRFPADIVSAAFKLGDRLVSEFFQRFSALGGRVLSRGGRHYGMDWIVHVTPLF